jgi:hypothetical protein
MPAADSRRARTRDTPANWPWVPPGHECGCPTVVFILSSRNRDNRETGPAVLASSRNVGPIFRLSRIAVRVLSPMPEMQSSCQSINGLESSGRLARRGSAPPWRCISATAIQQGGRPWRTFLARMSRARASGRKIDSQHTVRETEGRSIRGNGYSRIMAGA